MDAVFASVCPEDGMTGQAGFSDFVTEIIEFILKPRMHGRMLETGTGDLGMSKKRYSPPVLRNLTPEQAKKIIADGKNCSEKEAAEFLQSLQRQKPQNDQKPSELKDNQEKKRSA